MRDERIAAVAALQRGRVSREQLAALAVSRGAIARLLQRGALYRRRHGVYAAGHGGAVELGYETEALLAVGGHSALSHVTAASLWRMLPTPHPDHGVDVTVKGEAGRRRPGIRVHRSRTLTDPDIRIRQGLPLTSPARTLTDLADLTHARRLTIRALERALDEAIGTKLVRLRQVQEQLARSPGRHGAPLLAELVAQRTTSTRTTSKLNERLFGLIRAANLPQPELDVKVHGFEIDFYWRGARYGIEADSYQWHSSPFAFKRDRRKDIVLDDAGIELDRITWEMVDEPLALVARIARKLAEGLAPARGLRS